MRQLLLAVALLVLQTGCAGTFSKTGMALIALHTEGGNATGVPVGPREGQACSMNVLGFITVGNGSVQAAARDGGLVHISTVDFRYMNILGFFGRVCTLVTGDSEPAVAIVASPPPVTTLPPPPPAPAPAPAPAPTVDKGPGGACVKDMDCKGERVCTKGHCTSP